MALISGPSRSGTMSRVRLGADVPSTRNSYSASPALSTSATAMVVGSEPTLDSSRLAPSETSRSASSRPNTSFERRPRKAVGTPSRASARAVLKGPPPGTLRCVPSPLWITSIKAWLQKIGEQDVVEADQGDTLVEPEASKSAEGPDRDQVLAGEQRCRGVLAVEQFVRGGFGLLDSAQVEPHDSFVELDLLLSELFRIATITLGSSGNAAQVTQIADADMPLSDQVPDAASHPGGVVREHCVGIEK